MNQGFQNNSFSEPMNFGFEPMHSQNSKNNRGFAIASMVLGIVALVSCCCCCMTYWIMGLLAILAIVFAIVSRVTTKKMHGMAIAGLILGIVALVIAIGLFALEIWASSLSPEALEAWLKEMMGEEAYQEYLNMMKEFESLEGLDTLDPEALP